MDHSDSVFVHINPKGWRATDLADSNRLILPGYLVGRNHITLQYGYNMPVPIQNFSVGLAGIGGVLSFKTKLYYCFVPWDNIFAIVVDAYDAHIWNKDAPAGMFDKDSPKQDRIEIPESGTYAPVIDLAQYRRSKNGI